MERKQRYTELLEAGFTPAEQTFIQQSDSPNQITGNLRLVDKNQRRAGLRVEQQGRSRHDEKLRGNRRDPLSPIYDNYKF